MPTRPVGARAHRHPPRKTRRPPPRARGGKKRRWSRPRRSDRIGFRPPAALPTPSPRVRAPRRRWIGWWGFRRANRRRFAASSRFFRREFVLPGRCLDLGCGACVEWEWEEGIELLSFFSCNRPWRFLEFVLSGTTRETTREEMGRDNRGQMPAHSSLYGPFSIVHPSQNSVFFLCYKSVQVRPLELQCVKHTMRTTPAHNFPINPCKSNS